MADLSREDLQNILQEQNELRLRLVALDRKIEQLQIVPIPAEANLDPLEESATFSTPPPPLPEVSPQIQLGSPPKIPSIEKPPETSSWEFKLGTVWLVRIGIVILLTGLVFFGNYAYHYIVPRLGPWLKLALLAFLGGGLAGLGSRLEKSSESLRNYGRVLLAGGVALLYYTTYGAAFVEKLRVIDSPLIGGVLLLAVAAFVVWLAEKRHAQSVALTAILLSYYTSAINPLGLFSLYSSLLLTLAAVYFLQKHRWTTVGFLGLVGTYGNFAFWHFKHTRSDWLAIGFLGCYWLVFTVAVFLSRSTQFTPEKRTPFLTINNAAFFGLVFQILNANHPTLTGRFSLVFGAVLLALAWWAKRRQTEDLFLDGAYLIQGLGVLTFGLLTELNGYQLSLALALQGTVMLLSINRRHGWVYEIGAGVVTLLALLTRIFDSREFGLNDLPTWTLFGLFMVNAWLVKNFKKHRVARVIEWQALAYSLLAVFLIPVLADKEADAVFYCLATIVLVLAGTAFRLRELALASQILTIMATGIYCLDGEKSHEFLTMLSVLITPLLLIYWWRRQSDIQRKYLGQAGFFFLFFAILTRWIDFSGSAFPKTPAWAALGTVALCLGLVIRERTYRVCGLAVLAMAIIRVFVNDIWGLEPIFRILSFLILGFVLLALGFIYNKFADKFKEWL